MQATRTQLDAVLAAAERLLAARADQMLTAEEWEALENAVAACGPAADAGTEAFRVEDGDLVRSVVPRRGSAYEHRCSLANFETVAHAIDELEGERVWLEDLVARTGLPYTQVNTALAFLKERGCVVPAHGRKHRAATVDVHLNGMTEYHALREGESA